VFKLTIFNANFEEIKKTH